MTFSNERPTLYNRDPYDFHSSASVPKTILDVALSILKSWDMVDTDYAYVDWFHEDGALIVGQEPLIGHEAIHAAHNALVHAERGPLINLQHYVDKIWVRPEPSEGEIEVAYNGKLINVLKTGEEVTTEFFTLLQLSPVADEGDKLKADRLKVYSDTSILMAKIGEMYAQNGTKE
jgi:hypothetical protein